MAPELKPGDLCFVKGYKPYTVVRLTRMAFGNEYSPPPHQWWGQYCDPQTFAVKSTKEWWWLEMELERVRETVT